MRAIRFLRAGLVVVLMLGVGRWANAQAVPVAPAGGASTLWNFLGIPQGINKVRDATSNKKGNRPNKERKPPLKRIADPANLESQNPAIKAAAKIKTEEDLAPQKVKAIKYLGTIGCGCYPGVREALLAALDDCTEEVRYQAAIAFCQAAGTPCKHCDRSGCCNAAVMTKLEEIAHGQDEKCCYKETSARVRAAAESALNACRNRIPPSPAAVPKELPTKEVPLEPTPATPRESLPQPPEKPAPTASARDGVLLRPVSMTGVAEANDGASDVLAKSSLAADPNAVALARRCPRGYRTFICPPTETYAPSETENAAPAPAPGGEESVLPSNALAGNYGSASGPMSASPNMIGDFFGGGARFFGNGVLSGVQDASVGIAGGDRRFKIVEGVSPIPVDRVFFNYNHFQNPLQDVNGNLHNLDRYTFGLEKTFRDGLWSVELRGPVASDYNSTQSTLDDASLSDTEFGDLAVAVKRLLVNRERLRVSAGLGLTFPTGENWVIEDSFGAAVEVQNQSTHLQPFLGALWEPNDRWFVLAFTQMDFDSRGNNVLMRSQDSTGDLASVGVFQEQNLLFFDVSAGYWLYKNPRATWITGMGPVVELHYATTVQNEDFVSGPLGAIGASSDGGPGRRDVLNLTAGMNFQLGACSLLTVAAAAPLKTGVNREYDSEIIVQFNRRF